MEAVAARNEGGSDSLRTFGVGQAAELLGVSRFTIGKWRQLGYLPNKGRWTRAELEAVEVPPAAPRGRRPEPEKPAPEPEQAAPQGPLPDFCDWAG